MVDEFKIKGVESLLYFLSNPILNFLIYLDFPGKIISGMFGV